MKVKLKFLIVVASVCIASPMTASDWIVEDYEGVDYPTFSYEPVYVDYTCATNELFIAVPQTFGLIFDDTMQVHFGTRAKHLAVVDAYVEEDEQHIVLGDENLTNLMVDANRWLLLPDGRAGVGIPLAGFSKAVEEACQ